MPRQLRQQQPNYCYHITVRCNNREFRLIRDECREVLLYAIKKCQEKFGFRLYALCIMSNHVHYLLEPKEPDDLPKMMHWLNWYTAMCFNRILNLEKEPNTELGTIDINSLKASLFTEGSGSYDAQSPQQRFSSSLQF